MANFEIGIGGMVTTVANLALGFYLTQTFANRVVSFFIAKEIIHSSDKIWIVLISISCNIVFAILMNLLIERPVKKLVYEKSKQ